MKGIRRVSRELRQNAEAYRNTMYAAYPGSRLFAKLRRNYCVIMACSAMAHLVIIFLLVLQGLLSPVYLWSVSVIALIHLFIFFIAAHGSWKASLPLWLVGLQSVRNYYEAFGSPYDFLSIFTWGSALLSFTLAFEIAYIAAAALGAAWLTLSPKSRRNADIVREIYLAYLRYIQENLDKAESGVKVARVSDNLSYEMPAGDNKTSSTVAESDISPKKEEKFRPPLLLFAPFTGMFLGLIADYISICPAFVDLLVGEAQTPQELLLAYRLWYAAIMCAAALSISLAAAGILVFVKKGGLQIRGAIRMMAICFGLTFFLGAAMIAMEDVPGLYSRAGADLARIKSGDLPEVTVWLSPKTRKVRLPGPYSKGQPEPVTRYGGISFETGGKWVAFYVPDGLGFSLDQDALYREGRSIQWNERHARKYLIRYTENFRVVVSAEPVDNVAAAK